MYGLDSKRKVFLSWHDEVQVIVRRAYQFYRADKWSGKEVEPAIKVGLQILIIE